MNFCPSALNLKPKGRQNSKGESINHEIEDLKRSMAERERKILQDISNVNRKSQSFQKYDSNTNSNSKSLLEDNISMPVHSIDTSIQQETNNAIESLKNRTPSLESLEYFGEPDIRV